MDQSGEGNGNSCLMADCCDDAHVQKKVLSEEGLGSFGSELSSHFRFLSKNINIHNINNMLNKTLLLDITDVETEFSINRKLEILQIFALKLQV